MCIRVLHLALETRHRDSLRVRSRLGAHSSHPPRARGSRVRGAERRPRAHPPAAQPRRSDRRRDGHHEETALVDKNPRRNHANGCTRGDCAERERNWGRATYDGERGEERGDGEHARLPRTGTHARQWDGEHSGGHAVPRSNRDAKNAGAGRGSTGHGSRNAFE